ncbi:histidine phosphatase family protein [Mycobacterium sp. CVI_P3]|uniref:Histidine phosphatase family protein n=1 Tax=Mycobacterium pinniadriaticum TaxID=2994102 RepID=A0ABT3S6Z3_9MYCO|nr:histidine phosphatase family protein [Mycobacterium pinniadriaticum]MCX2929006.1 histidine phosphatase family protein [Mycobacterium pinniadriaticum]MCX2935127.1 histidine phosphatase family protein [Mycobacterium pinniadriaticum]
MSEVVRLTLVSHAMTDAMAVGRFPVDEELNALGRRQLDELDVGTADMALCGPEVRARQSAELLGLRARVDARLADLDCGRWRGMGLDMVEPDLLTLWLTEPARGPHGGESIVEMITRVRGWLADISRTPGRTVAVTHPAVIRAVILNALDAPPKSFWRVDVAPASCTTLHFRGMAWTLRSGSDHR